MSLALVENTRATERRSLRYDTEKDCRYALENQSQKRERYD